ncbi:metabotropic glutamate receptor 2 [Eurytemora carolleeae]|uniref:metabotropic glutamate receptor 2 n=1 Tax=Eurytemora carolleeae TaxID=1294199 RepID=UPI000C782AE6|nr:metabotropic glutamate receptor 2 [Eurytemora carolleeae]|eukprot:XP_023342942.1 metabotropic glutamate receptor 2-like [Eurytemora affinis]
MPKLLWIFLLVQYIPHISTEVPYLTYSGDIMLGALFPIHKQGEAGELCGQIQDEDGIQPLEALLFTLDEINRNESILPNIKLGAIVRDSCDTPRYAAEQSLDLLQGFMYRSVKTIHPDVFCSNETVKNIVGIIGAQTSQVSLEVARLGRLFKVPQISYLSTAVVLSDQNEFPYFFRTVPSDIHQARAILGVLEVLGYHYASVVHTQTDYGTTGYEALVKYALAGKKVCLAKPLIIQDGNYDDVINNLLKNQMTKVVIVFADRIPAGKLLEAAKNRNVTSKFVWIGSDAWASRESVVYGREEVVEGAIAVQPLRRALPGFSEYFNSLSDLPDNNARNPWYAEYYSTYCNCSLAENIKEMKKAQNICPFKQKSKDAKNVQQQYLHFLRDAVYAFALALDDLRRESCKHTVGVCDKLRLRMYKDLKYYLAKVSFPDVDNFPFRFKNETRDGPARYSIITYYRRPSGEFDWENVGTFQGGEIRDLNLSFSEKNKEASYINSHVTCRRNLCASNEIKIPEGHNDGCCWNCQKCHDFEYKYSEFGCKSCPKEMVPLVRDDGTSDCRLAPEDYLDYTNPWALGALAFAGIGLVMTTITMGVLWKYWNTPVVKACSRELSCVLIMGTFISFCTTFIIVTKPTGFTCGVMRFLIGFCYTLCYAAVVTKTNRISRIFSAQNVVPKCTSPTASVVITLALTSVEVVVLVIWLVIEPASTETISEGKTRILVCKGVDQNFMIGLFFPFLLIISATMYAFKTRKCPGGFNETRFILFTNCINTIHWLAFVPLYLVSADHKIKAVILAYSLSLSGVVQLSCLVLKH